MTSELTNDLTPEIGDLVAFTAYHSTEVQYGIITKIGYADWKGDVKRKIHARAKHPEEWERCYQLSNWDDWNVEIIRIIERNGKPLCRCEYRDND